MLSRDERQNLGIKKWMGSKCRGTWMWATGVGKTYGAIKAIKAFLTKNKDRKILVVVPTEYLKIQWLTALSKNGLYHDVSVEIINSAIENKQKVDFIILDEVHRYASDSFYAIFRTKNPEIVLGLSATFNRLDGRHELLKKYCPVCDIITVKEAIENNWLSPYKEYKVLLEVEDIHIYNQLNKDFFDAFSMFEFSFDTAMKCLTNIIYRRSYAKKLGISAGEMDAIVFTWNRTLKARKSFVMDHPKKIEIARKILSHRPNSKGITFSGTIKQAEKIGNGYIVHSGKTKKKNRLTIQEFMKIPVGTIHTAKSLDEGSDIPGLNLAIILYNSSSSTQKTQRIGRVIRYEENKTAEIFTLVIKGTNEEKWYDNSTAGKAYIEIDEVELDEVLENNPIEAKERIGVEQELLFRI